MDDYAGLVERLGEMLRESPGGGDFDTIYDAATAITTLQTRRMDAEINAAVQVQAAETALTDALAKLAAAEGALRPFVAHWQKWMDEKDRPSGGLYNHADDDEMSTFARVTYGDLRRARSALTSGKQEAGGE